MCALSSSRLFSWAFSSKCGEADPEGKGQRRKIGNRARNLAIITAEIAAQVVAIIEVPTIAVGLTERLAARMAIAVTGMSCTELVLIARKVHIALVAVPG